MRCGIFGNLSGGFRMKISYFNTHFPYKNKPSNEKSAVSGAEAVADNLASAMAQKGHEISIFTTSATPEDKIEEYDGIKVYRYAFTRSQYMGIGSIEGRRCFHR